MERRVFLGGAFAAAGIDRSKAAMGPTGLQDFDAPLAPVKVATEREIASRVGFRPFRAEGFVVRSEALGHKLLVHNYGHGGAGVTLSWGSARLALSAAGSKNFDSAAVIGAGIIGLTTAISLARAGVAVTIYAEASSPETTSDVAAALWQPSTIFRTESMGAAAMEQFRFAARVSHDAFRDEAGRPGRGVRWIRMFDLSETPFGSERPEGADLYPGSRPSPGAARRFGVAHAECYYALVIDMSVYLPALIAEFARLGGRLIARRFDSPAELGRLDDAVVFNCTGMGSRTLFADRLLTPVRGQITWLKGQPEVDYGYVFDGPQGLLYMFPRENSIALGGSMGWGETSPTIDENDKRRMIEGHARISARLSRQL